MKTKPSFVTPNEVARALRVSKQTVYRVVSAGRLRALHIGGSIRIRKADLDLYIRENTGGW